MQGYLAVSDLPLVSMDFKKSDVSTTIDSSLTMVMGDDMVKVSLLHTVSVVKTCRACLDSMRMVIPGYLPETTCFAATSYAVLLLSLHTGPSQCMSHFLV